MYSWATALSDIIPVAHAADGDGLKLCFHTSWCSGNSLWFQCYTFELCEQLFAVPVFLLFVVAGACGYLCSKQQKINSAKTQTNNGFLLGKLMALLYQVNK